MVSNYKKVAMENYEIKLNLPLEELLNEWSSTRLLTSSPRLKSGDSLSHDWELPLILRQLAYLQDHFRFVSVSVSKAMGFTKPFPYALR